MAAHVPDDDGRADRVRRGVPRLTLRLAAACAGFALALWLAPLVQRPASPHELPGAMQAAGLSPSGPLLQFALIALLPFAAAFLPSASSHAGRPVRFPYAIVVPATLLIYLTILHKHPRTTFLIALAIAIALTPLLNRIPGRARLALYALFVFAYPLLLLRRPLPLDFYEDGHELVIASELMRGERPYTDVVPVHGLLSDGGLDWLVLEVWGRASARPGVPQAAAASLPAILRTKLVVSCLNLLAIFCIAFAATGNADLALLAAMLSVMLIPSATIWIRTIPSLLALACIAAAVRLRSSRWLLAAGALLPLAVLFGIDFAAYSAVVALAVALRMRRVRALFVGIAIGSIPLIPIAIPLLKTTLLELLPAGRVYVPGKLAWPAERVPLALWILALLFAAATTRLRIRRSEAAWPLALWVVIAGVSFAQRRHLYATFAMTAFAIALLWLIARRRRYLAAVLAIALALLARPWDHIFKLAAPLRLAGGIQQPLVSPEQQKALDAARRFTAARLGPNETYFDFSNSAALYYFLGRNCPTRHQQVPFYESESAQREVIAAIQRNRSVRAALIECPGGNWTIDGIPNRTRAPLVWHYLQTNFTPAFAEDGVIFWLRR
ncbi:MAG TPA: hypothetical protein VGR02_08635 [Thermoanaerobaculia bacterium]|jgi:hypothetical protein|nr:hypothetical protein [Thermoanaerobaculia bacterium]